ncbi:MAG TPA: sugar ABC transporter permease [Bacteroidota bacterium]|jgi:multiple sugar transport system permease protein|nr:sugar ABC transporter permease [Bacteroidota bacterium]
MIKRWLYKLEPYFYLAPTIIGLLLFSAGAVIMSFLISFTKWDVINPPKFIGFQNYLIIFQSELFWKIFGNTFYYVILNVPPSIVIPLIIAVLLNQKLKGINIFRSIYFLPVISSIVAIALVWSWLYNPEFGLINYVLKKFFNIDGPRWLEDENWAMPAMVIMNVWKSMGYNMVLFLASLQNIPDSLYEVSEIDGASGIKKFFNITLPLISPTTFFVFIITIISSFQVFEQTYILTKGGPANSTLTLSYYIYQNAFLYLRMGYSSALSYILFGIIFIITLLQFKYQKKWVHYT